MKRSERRRKAQRTAPPRAPAPAPVPARSWAPPAIVTRIAGPLLIVAAGIGMLAHTWRTWPDPLIDYGRELYLAWRVSEGATLYADVAHFNGPLSTYVNALVFRLFGPGILTLALANAALAAGCMALLYVLIARTADRFAATFAGLVFAGAFACSRYTKLGNYNWLCPYSYELTHGVLLGVAAVAALDRYQRIRRIVWMAVTGGALGLLALTKVETVLAGALAVAIGLALVLVVERPPMTRLARLAAAFAGGLAAPLFVTFVYFVRRLSVAEVLAWPLGYWHAASRPEFVAMPFYREGFGTDDVAGNLTKLAFASVGYLVVVAIATGAAFVAQPLGRSALVAGLLGVATAVTAVLLVPFDVWVAAPRPLSLLMLLVVGGAAVEWLRVRHEPERAANAALRVVLGVLALGFLLKLGLNVRIFHYGFALAMPATLVLLAALLTWLPAAVSRMGGEGRVVRALFAGLAVVCFLHYGAYGERRLNEQATRLGTGADAIYGDDRAAALGLALAEIEHRVAPEQTLLALPEGVMLNYLSRRRSPLAYPQYSPVTLILWGEDRMVRDFDAHPPDFVLLVHRENTHEGARFFGRDYATALMERVQRNYRQVWQTGAPPLRDARFGLALLERVSSPTSGSP